MRTRNTRSRVDELRRRASIDALIVLGATIGVSAAVGVSGLAHHPTGVGRVPTSSDLGLLAAIGGLCWFGARRWNDAAAVDAHFARHRAERDELTQLPTRAVLKDQLVRLSGRARRTGQSVAVLFLDLDRFKGVNDTCGHETGDALLVAVADRLRDTVREGDLLTRYGGDEFVILCPNVKNERQAEGVAQRIADAFSEPFAADGNRFSISVSIGIAFCVAGRDTDPSAVIRNADTAMYMAKTEGRGCSVAFAQSMSAARAERNQTAIRVATALEKSEFHLVYQPVVALHDTRLVSVEALLRWTDTERGPVSPAEFIPMLEQTGLIVEVGTWVLHDALRQAVKWKSRFGDLAPGVAVNVTALQLTQANFADTVLAALERTGAEPNQLCIEVTEAGLMADIAASWTGLRTLKRAGVKLALDDFGTGYSSLSYVRNFALDYVKIDQSFVKGIVDSAEDHAIIEATVRLATALGIRAVAEGIETPEQVDALRLLGCHLGQGYLFSRPQLPQELDAIITGIPHLATNHLTRVV
ncbi:MAG: putative bifunctional diguanylate cyclase/phosphodiesterase [Actinomycetota bacterium]